MNSVKNFVTCTRSAQHVMTVSSVPVINKVAQIFFFSHESIILTLSNTCLDTKPQVAQVFKIHISFKKRK